MKFCPKCNKSFIHNFNKFCSRQCANSRGPRSEEHKKIVSRKLSYRKICRVKISPITGRFLSRDNPNISFWDKPCKHRFIRKLANWFNITLGKFPDSEIELDAFKRNIEVMYYDDKLSSSQIKSLLKIPLPDGHMPAFLKQLGITRRSFSESIHEYILNQHSNYKISSSKKYKAGWHTDWEGKTHYYRSSYELKMYKILDAKNKRYATETLKIKYYDEQKKKYRVAIPDIIINNLIIEIKSLYTFDAVNMNNKFSAYKKLGYRPMLILEGKWCKWRESNSHFSV